MNELEKTGKEELLKELELLEEQYVRAFASKFDKNELKEIWDRIKTLKDELTIRQREGKEQNPPGSI